MNPCTAQGYKYWSAAEQAGCNFTTASEVDIGLIYNDVWAYKLCNATNGERGFDSACKETGWVVWHVGALQGGEYPWVALLIILNICGLQICGQ